jgi:capsular polysaccharide transport system permease protein
MRILDTPGISNTALSNTAAPKARRRLPRPSILLLATVIIPTLVAGIYFGLMASDIYTSESRFVVRNPQRQATPGIGALLQGAGFARSQDDTYSVLDFIQSRDALHALDSKLGLYERFGNKHIDFLSRLDPFGMDKSFESLYLYYLKRVDIRVDTASSISSLKVTAFSAGDAYAINAALLDMAERLVNELNERGRQDLIRYASFEVDSAAKRARTAAEALSDFRTGERLFDPDRQSALQLQQVSRLQDELVASNAQLTQLRTYTPQNPQIPALQTQVSNLRSEIAAATGRVSGTNSSLARKSSDYERLALERTVADKQLAGALAALEQARNDAQRKQLYLERIVQPNKPDIAMQPRRLRAIFATFMLGLVAWGILSVLIAGLREHHD